MAKKSNNNPLNYLIGAMRIGLGWIFLWAFADKLWGLGYATCLNPETSEITRGCSAAWVNGGSPTTGFLKFATKGPFADFFQGLAGNTFIDWLFMLGLLLIGLALILGVGIKIAAISGSVLMLTMWLAALLPEHNPLVDDHIIYIIALMIIMVTNNKQVLGLGDWWQKQKVVKQYTWLQ